MQCGDCGNLYVRANAVKAENCQAGIFRCPDCKYFTHNKQEMNYHVADKHAPSFSMQLTVCSSCEKEFLSY